MYTPNLKKTRENVYLCRMNLDVYQLFYTANLIFILTNLYGWMLKWFYKPEAYGDSYASLFPGQKIVGVLYLAQICELPYLLMIGNAAALFYVNVFSVLLFPALMVIMCESYFFLKRPSIGHWVIYFFPTTLLSLYLLAHALGWIPISDNLKLIIFWIVTLFALGYAFMIVREQIKIRQQIRRINEMSYSSEGDFPARFARRIEWLPLAICLLMYVNFAADDSWIKMWRDLIFTIVNVWFMFYTLNPHRKVALKQEAIKLPDNSNYRLSQERCSALQSLIFETVTNEKLYLDPHLSVDTLSKKVGSNKSYISEALVRSSYGSFYSAINQFRIDYASNLLLSQPEISIEAIAKSAGFSSASLFSRLFKQQKGISPSRFAMQNKIPI